MPRLSLAAPGTAQSFIPDFCLHQGTLYGSVTIEMADLGSPAFTAEPCQKSWAALRDRCGLKNLST